MKKLVLITAITGICSFGMAQKNNRTTAGMALNNYNKYMAAQDLASAKKEILKAKEFIDKAAVHESTINDARTMFYKGEIYLGMIPLAMDVDIRPIVEQEGFMGEIKDAYTKAMKLDDKDEYKPQIEQKMNMYRALSVNAGSDFFQKKDYAMAQSSFEAAVAMWDLIGLQDTIGYFYAGMSAEYQDNSEKAIEYYTKAMDLGYKDVVLYQLLTIQYKNEKYKDSPEREKVLTKGRQLFPADQVLILEEFNYHFEKGNNDKAQAALDKAIELDPRNPILYYNIGVMYDGLQMYDKAEQSYVKAIELNKEYFEANFNLAAMYVNIGVEMSSKASDIKDFKLYEKELEKSMAQFKKAIPYFERAAELMPEDADVWKSLASLYYKLDMNDKYEAADKKAKELSGK